jgi:F-type H+-transporting ATPase subunit delta
VETCFGGKVEAEVLTFLKLLIDRDRFNSAEEILEAVIEITDKKSGLVNVYVCSAQALDSISSQQVSRSLGAIFGEGIVMHTTVDPDMLGGLTVRVGDYLIDGSVRRHLIEMKKRILEAPIQGDLWED